ncbi:MAG: hypothetical protein UV53_C0024G0006 [Candidatus Azambacteria bacterium GW2011_GWE1_42_9]|nr:MAG: hypothetical protein UU33_C0001G0255 [Candidatus Azambacteria bacterium GW2011_GWF1_41_10]KKS49287.1 MAG: hypothetical protein UV14_C0001G0033 [Candidatus Azambacteria bacterium GW2011_GWF2_42_22]KKS69544.1 MAG: hypothetical protein UV39_C0008G0002 [Candidatus Azambacteria bacterium GW2011_GWA2_42_62]KKS78769.1 MAG: hypothetical protein UV53_C0024G0006 [Candidatus Azambacteria bacterium GW2011_GWE1_42_9]KKT02893.1 MAG: hypothetical protein UV81_C0006G0003 [Candidatus Azambacteria bacter
MKIITTQKSGQLEVIFKNKNLEESFVVAKADEFLNVIDKFIGKHKICPIGRIGQMGPIEFYNVGLLTERTIRVIMQGLSFS